jgi:hypothetical protein
LKGLRKEKTMIEYKPLDVEHNVKAAVENMREAYWSNNTEKYAKQFTDAQSIITSAICFGHFTVCEEVVMFKGEQKNELQAGDIVITPAGKKAIIIGIEEWNNTKLASIYSEYYALPQMFPVQDLKATGFHKNVRSILLDLLKENEE